MAKTETTAPGRGYCVTCTQACTVQAIKADGSKVFLASCDGAGQVSFIAPTGEVYISDDSAFLTPFRNASPAAVGGGSASGGGGSSFVVDQTFSATSLNAQSGVAVAQGVEAMLTASSETVSLYTGTGTDNATCQYVILDPARVPDGELTEISYRTATTTTSGMTTDPLWLAVWEAVEGSSTEYEFAGVSSNSIVQAVNSTLAWQFDNIRLHGRRVKLIPTTDPAQTASATAYWRVRTFSSTDTTTCNLNAYSPQMTLTAVVHTLRFAPHEHVDDAVMHVTAEERAAWDAAARGELTEEQLGILGSFEWNSTYGLSLVHKDADGNIDGRLRLMPNTGTVNLVSGYPVTIQSPHLVETGATNYHTYADTSTGNTYCFGGHTMSSTDLSVYGITKPCSFVGDDKLDTYVRGDNVWLNGNTVYVNNLFSESPAVLGDLTVGGYLLVSDMDVFSAYFTSLEAATARITSLQDASGHDRSWLLDSDILSYGDHNLIVNLNPYGDSGYTTYFSVYADIFTVNDKSVMTDEGVETMLNERLGDLAAKEDMVSTSKVIVREKSSTVSGAFMGGYHVDTGDCLLVGNGGTSATFLTFYLWNNSTQKATYYLSFNKEGNAHFIGSIDASGSISCSGSVTVANGLDVSGMLNSNAFSHFYAGLETSRLNLYDEGNGTSQFYCDVSAIFNRDATFSGSTYFYNSNFRESAWFECWPTVASPKGGIDLSVEAYPAGAIVTSLSSYMPGYLLCDGAEVSRDTYATLFGVLGTTYGEGDGSTTFNLPDMSGHTIGGISVNVFIKY